MFPVWSHAGSDLSSSSESQTVGDSGISSYRKPWNDARSTAQHNHTPRYSPDTVKRLEEGGPRGCSPKQPWWEQRWGPRDGERRWRGWKNYGGWPHRANRTRSHSPQVWLSTSRWHRRPRYWLTRQILMMRRLAGMPSSLLCRVFHTTTHTLSDEYQEACKEVQTIVWKSPEEINCHRPYLCMGGLGRHPLVGKSSTPDYGLHGGEHGGAAMPIAGG